MSNKYSILLNEKKNKYSNNVDNNIEISIDSTKKMLPIDNISDTISEYKQYLKEKNASNIYRFTFTVNPFCTNVLFNILSEIVYKEGSDECINFTANGASSSISGITSIVNYRKYKGITTNAKGSLTRYDLIEDTGYSNSEIGPIVYHCGLDIFNNHTLRKKYFGVINKLSSAIDNNDYRINFNTLSDYLRDRDGEIVEDVVSILNSDLTLNFEKEYIHAYGIDTVYSFNESVDNNLIEKDGWIGFNNPVSMDIKNYGDISLNKCMNNNKPCEMYDLYPDRSLFSFIPKVNKYRKRLEKNWEYCLTYPYKNYYDNELVQNQTHDVNGLKATVYYPSDLSVNDDENESDITTITFRTLVVNNLSAGDYIGISIISNEGVTEIINDIKVVGVGYAGEDASYYFTISYEDVDDYIDILNDKNNEIRIRRIVNDTPCKYYFRIFKRIPNFNDTHVYDDDKVTDDEINTYTNVNFNSSINKNAFSRTIFNDNVCEINYNENVKLSGLKDNLGRDLSEIYLTLIKTNYGNDEWYKVGNYRNKTVEFSHCFSKLTAGVDLFNPYEIDINGNYIDNDYDVKRIHNIDVSEALNNFIGKSITLTDCKKINNIISYTSNDTTYELYDLYTTPKNLEEDNGSINISGDTTLGCGEFFGDIVEFSINDVKETILEDVLFRFNTYQREMTNNKEFFNLYYSEITSDDEKIFDETGDGASNGEFNVEKKNLYNSYKLNDGTHTFPANLFREGYYYKPHYKVTLKEYFDTVNQNGHTKMKYTISASTEQYLSIVTSLNYILNPRSIINGVVYPGDKVLLETVDTHKMYECEVYEVSGKSKCFVILYSEEDIFNKIKEKFILYKYNVTKPTNAYEMADGTGRYLWREMKSEEDIDTDSDIYNSMFTNGAHYFHKTINFYLKRQNPIDDTVYPSAYQRLIVEGKYKDVSSTIYEEDDDNDGIIC